MAAALQNRGLRLKETIACGAANIVVRYLLPIRRLIFMSRAEIPVAAYFVMLSHAVCHYSGRAKPTTSGRANDPEIASPASTLRRPRCRQLRLAPATSPRSHSIIFKFDL